MFIPSTTITARTHDVGLPVQCWASVEAHSWRSRRSQPEVSDRHPVHTTHCCFNADKSSTTLAQHYSNTGSGVYLAAKPQPKPVIYPMLAQGLLRWPDISTALGDCPVVGRTAA